MLRSIVISLVSFTCSTALVGEDALAPKAVPQTSAIAFTPQSGLFAIQFTIWQGLKEVASPTIITRRNGQVATHHELGREGLPAANRCSVEILSSEADNLDVKVFAERTFNLTIDDGGNASYDSIGTTTHHSLSVGESREVSVPSPPGSNEPPLRVAYVIRPFTTVKEATRRE